MTTAGIPLVRVDLDTSQYTAELWANARAIAPSEFEWFTVVRSTPIETGRVRVTIAMDQDQFANFAAMDGAHHAASYIEEIINCDARDIVTAHETEIAFNALPAAADEPKYGPYTFVVEWALAQAVDFANEAKKSTGLLAKVRIVRLTPPAHRAAWFAVTVPRKIYDRIIAISADPTQYDGQDMFVSNALTRVWLEENPHPEPDLSLPSSGRAIDDEIPF